MSNYRLKAAAISTILIVGGLILYEPPTPVKVERPQNTPVQKENPVGVKEVLEQVYGP